MEPQPPEEARRKIGKYEIVEKIATGGFGTVYKAWDPMIRRAVALKTCEVPDANMRARAFREAQLAGNLHHPNITTIYEFGIEGIVPFIVQELLSGEDLDRIIGRGTPLPLPEKVRILIAVASALEFAHGRGIVHRDIKPANIRILDDGVVKIMDFGIAKSLDSTTSITKDGTAVGSTSYMSPEQIVGESIDARTDIFSLGVVAYELLTGRKPFEHEKLFLLLEQIVKSEAAPLRELAPEVPEPLAAVVRARDGEDAGGSLRIRGRHEVGARVGAGMLSDAAGPSGAAPEAREAERLLALARYAILDTAPEAEFDDLTRLASVLCGTPFASLSFADANRLWFKSRVGIEESALPLEASLGARAIRNPDVFVVRDAAEDPRFVSEASGPGSPALRFYAGVPLRTRDGYVVGALAVMDRQPRDLSGEQIESLRALSRQAVAQLELRRMKRERVDRRTGPGAAEARAPSPVEGKP